MLPAELKAAVDSYLRDLSVLLPGRVAAVYLVGSTALDDFSHRQSNVDLVVVAEPGLSEGERASLSRAERSLARAGRAAAIWYTDWATIADGQPSGHGLDTPMTRALLRGEAPALQGPDWPVVGYDDAEFRAWCRRRLAEVTAEAQGLLVMRRGVVPIVLEAARLAYGAVHGRVLSKSEAGEVGRSLVPQHFRRILSDAVGYRQGANTSMYWGPFERKYDARQLLVHLGEAAAEAVAP